MKAFRKTALINAFTLATLTCAHALESAPTLGLDVAKQMVAGCEAKAKAEGWAMSVTVVDAGANAVASERMNGAYLGSLEISRLKAETAAKFPFPTRQIEAIAYGKDGKPALIPGLAAVPGLIAFAGGLPAMSGGNAKVGAIGASGGLPSEDEACAQAGLEAAAPALK